MKVLLLSGQGLRCDILYSHLNQKYDISGVVIDNTYSIKEARTKKVKRRIKKYGLFKVISQIAFTRAVVPFLRMESKKRMAEMIGEIELHRPSAHTNKLVTTNINDKKVLDFILKNKPDVIVVHSTTIIKKSLLANIDKPIINFHIGITPKYRGLFGGYWAAYNADIANFGTTVHFLDEGIDTGKIITQKRIAITEKDNYYTYQFLQTLQGLECLDEALEHISINRQAFNTESQDCISKFYTQPTAAQYLYKRFLYGVK